MPQLMPLFWISYMFIFAILLFMMKGVYSIYSMEEKGFSQSDKKTPKDLWFW